MWPSDYGSGLDLLSHISWWLYCKWAEIGSHNVNTYCMKQILLLKHTLTHWLNIFISMHFHRLCTSFSMFSCTVNNFLVIVLIYLSLLVPSVTFVYGSRSAVVIQSVLSKVDDFVTFYKSNCNKIYLSRSRYLHSGKYQVTTLSFSVES